MSEVAPPRTKSPRDPTVCKAKVLEVLKGAGDLKEVEFRFHPYGSFLPEKLQDMIGKEYYVFLHNPLGLNRSSDQRWVLEGPLGIRPIAEEYTEYRFINDKVATETYSRSNYVAKIRSLARLEDSKKEGR